MASREESENKGEHRCYTHYIGWLVDLKIKLVTFITFSMRTTAIVFMLLLAAHVIIDSEARQLMGHDKGGPTGSCPDGYVYVCWFDI